MEDANNAFLRFLNVCFDTTDKLVKVVLCDEKTNRIENT